MALSFNPKTTAVVSMDFQNDICHPDAQFSQQVGFAPAIAASGVIPNTARLLAAARKAGMPVVHIVVDPTVASQFQNPSRGQFLQMLGDPNADPILVPGSWGATIHDEVAPLEGEPVIGKWVFSAFASSNLHETLQSLGVTDVMMAGVVTEFVIDSSCWNAVDLGYNVIIVDDGCCSADVETHKNCVAAMAARADITTVDEVVGLLAD